MSPRLAKYRTINRIDPNGVLHVLVACHVLDRERPFHCALLGFLRRNRCGGGGKRSRLRQVAAIVERWIFVHGSELRQLEGPLMDCHRGVGLVNDY